MSIESSHEPPKNVHLVNTLKAQDFEMEQISPHCHRAKLVPPCFCALTSIQCLTGSKITSALAQNNGDGLTFLSLGVANGVLRRNSSYLNVPAFVFVLLNRVSFPLLLNHPTEHDPPCVHPKTLSYSK